MNLDPFWVIFLSQSEVPSFLAGGLLDPERDKYSLIFKVRYSLYP